MAGKEIDDWGMRVAAGGSVMPREKLKPTAR